MALYYNNDGSVSEVIINAIINGIVTSSVAIAPNITDSLLASASNAVISASMAAASSSAVAYGLGHKGLTAANFTYSTQTTLSSTTPTPVAFGAVSANSASMAKYPSASYANFTFNTNIPVLIAADTTLEQIIDDRILVDEDLSHIADASLSPNVKTISAKQFGTTYSNGTVWVIGDDSTLRDVNLGNGFAIVGQQQINRGWVKFGSDSNGPLWGHNGNNVTAPAPGDGLYAVTGSLFVSSSKLLYYNGSNPTPGWNNGWAILK